MEELFTQNNLISFLYQEMSQKQEQNFHIQLQLDDQLADEYSMLKEAKQMLPKVLFNPTPSVLDRILAHSRSTAHETYC